MKALTLNGYEGLSSLKFVEVQTPEPGPNDVLVKVSAASVNPVDGKITTGYGGPSQRKLPHVLGRDCAGIIAKLGGAVTGFKVGDAVYGVADPARPKNSGIPVWTEEQVAAYEQRWPLGTRQRVWLDVLLYTGLRRGDAVRLGRQHVRNGVATIKTEKTDTEVTLPILPVLGKTLRAGPCGDHGGR